MWAFIMTIRIFRVFDESILGTIQTRMAKSFILTQTQILSANWITGVPAEPHNADAALKAHTKNTHLNQPQNTPGWSTMWVRPHNYRIRTRH